MSIKVQEEEDLPLFGGEGEAVQKDELHQTKLRIKEVMEFIDSSGDASISNNDIELTLKLVDTKKINFNNFEICIEEYIKRTEKYNNLISVFEAFGFITKKDINKITDLEEEEHKDESSSEGAKGKQNPYQNFKINIIDKQVARRIDFETAQNYSAMPFKVSEKTLYIAYSGSFEHESAMQILAAYNECEDFKKVSVDYSVLEEAMDLIYNERDELDEIIEKITKSNITADKHKRKHETHHNEIPRDLLTSLVDTIISNSVKMEASDIHIEPEENFVRIRYRIDGDMRIIKSIHKDYWSNILVRIKVLAGLNIAEIRRPQDGKISTTVYKRSIDCRVSTQPTVFGENVVIRILDKQKGLISLKQLGFYKQSLKNIQKANDRPDGIIIVVGPTGSGKTTTLYSMISELNTPDVNIMTLEDPVEYNIPMIRQINVNEAVGLTFESGMRSLVRQDPDIILIGEIRDKETLQAALRMSMTGHKVFSSLHAIDSIGAIQRLMDIGADVGSLTGNIGAVISQRLIKKLCPSCRQKIEPSEKMIEDLQLTQEEIESANICTHAGCSECDGTGYKGRMVIAEVLLFDENLDELIYQKASQTKLKKYTREINFASMSHDAKIKLLKGEISFDEVKKCIRLNV